MINILIIVCCSILFFARTLNYKYTSDDIPTYNATKDMYKDCWWKRLFFEIEGSIKINAKRDHIVTMILHTLVCVFIYVGFGMTQTSFYAALLFMVNPTNNQGSIWISGRGYVLPTLLLLAAISFPYVSPIFLLGATYFHTGFLTSVMFFFSPHQWLLLFMPFIWMFWFKRFRGLVKQKVDKEMFGEDKKIKLSKLVIFFKTFGFYLTLCLFPFRTTFYHAYMQSMSGNELMKKRAYKIDRYFFIGITSFIAMIYFIYTDPFSLRSLAISWWICGIAPYCNLFRFQQEIAERYAYLPLVGLSFILGGVLAEFPLFLTAFLSMYATRLWFYMPAYQDDYYLSEVACLNSRDAWFAWHIRAMKRWDTGARKEALTLWVMAKMVSPHEFKILINISTCLRLLKQDKEADEYLEEAMRHVPEGQEKQTQDLYKNLKKGKAAIIL